MLLRGDYQSRMNGYAIGRQNGWMSANDIRELENLDRIPAEDGGDLYLINGNMLPLKRNAGAFAEYTNGKGGRKRKMPMKNFWKWKNQAQTETAPAERTLYLNGTIAEESWFDDDVTPQLFKEELMSGDGDITVWINSPGGDCVAAAQIYNMLMDYPPRCDREDRWHRGVRRIRHRHGGHQGPHVSGVHAHDPQPYDRCHGRHG